MHTQGFKVQNRHGTDKAAAAVVDVLYDVFTSEIGKFVKKINPATKRPSKMSLSFDKATKDNHRQILEATILDTDGKPVTVCLAANLIKKIQDPKNMTDENDNPV